MSYQGIALQVTADTYHGTAAELLAQLQKNNEGLRIRDDGGFHVTSDPVTITNETGQRGVAAHFDGTNASGLLAAFVFGETGVEIEVVGPQAVSASLPADVAAMIKSVRPIEVSGS
ncbi:hypothetical protein Ate02nite_36510 [Paractinoplanes tereljensis]|uniref:Uncharacterized protein n=2 Tax=Paractinoplanes tereljensis TaxID=571912 RepID=A0A919NMZ8_9ACTN|nr:hypothetical protein Ate02nite_36510 [Actinoplanes tereljensis]